MTDVNLLQSEADALIAMEKIKTDDEQRGYPNLGGKLSIPLMSRDKRESFFLDIQRGRIDLLKNTCQNRALQIIILVRLDCGGPPHRNPDGTEIGSPHIHIYREGYGDKWAMSVPADHFSNLQSAWQTLQDFMKFCNIVEPPNIERGVFTC